MQGFFGQPDVRAIDIGGLFTGIHLHPMYFALAAVAFGHRRIHHFKHHRRNIHPGAVTLDVGDDGLVGNVQGKIGVDGDFLALGGNFDVLVHEMSLFDVESDGALPPARPVYRRVRRLFLIGPVNSRHKPLHDTVINQDGGRQCTHPADTKRTSLSTLIFAELHFQAQAQSGHELPSPRT